MTNKYRLESGPFVGQVDVADGVIVAAPNVWRKFIGQPLCKLEWWLAAKNHSCRKTRIPSEWDSMAECTIWEGERK